MDHVLHLSTEETAELKELLTDVNVRNISVGFDAEGVKFKLRPTFGIAIWTRGYGGHDE